MRRSGLHSQIICSRGGLILSTGRHWGEYAVTTSHPSRIRWMWSLVHPVPPNGELRVLDGWQLMDVLFSVVMRHSTQILFRVLRRSMCYFFGKQLQRYCLKLYVLKNSLQRYVYPRIMCSSNNPMYILQVIDEAML